MIRTKHISIFIIVVSITLSQFAKAQLKSKNAVYFEAFGNAIFYSVNFDRQFTLSDRLNLAPRVGIMYFPLTSFASNRDYGNISIPLELNFLWGRDALAKNKVEAGFGLNFIGTIQGYTQNQQGERDLETTRFAKITTVRFGFRHQKPEGGLMYRAGILIPILRDEYSKTRFGDDIFYQIYPALAVGYSF